MADWGITNLLDQLHEQVLEILKSRDTDAATAFVSTAQNYPVGAMRYNRTTSLWEEWSGIIWVTRVLSVAGGGTGASDIASAKASLGIGTLGTQNANAVAITGGSITGLATLTMSGHITFSATNQYNIGSAANRVNRIYIGGGAVAPVGVNKYVPV